MNVGIQFGSYTLDFETRQLTARGADVHLTRKAFDLLALLVNERPKPLSKTTLIERLWPDTFVAEANLSNLIAEIRAALGDRARGSQWIRTAHGFGYAFCGPTIESSGVASLRVRPACWLEWGQHRFPLWIGEHIVGREPDAQVRIDAPTVSRRHARVVVSPDRASLEDMGSKNGTRCGSHRVTARVELVDGDNIHIGSVLLTFRLDAHSTTTATQQ